MDNIHESLTRIDYTVIVVYVVSLLSLGFWVSFRKNKSDDLFLAGRTLKWGNIGLSIFGTNVNPSFMIASCGVAFSSGIVAANFEWQAWWFLMLLAMVFAPHYMNTRISTMPEFMSRRFDERCRNFLSWYALLTTMLVWLGTTLYAGGLLLGQILNWPLWTAVMALIVIATSFTVAGGLAAVVITDSFQSVLMIVASVILVIIGCAKVGSFERVMDTIPSDYWQLFRAAGDKDYPWYAIVLGYPVMGIWFWCTDQTIVQRALGGQNLRQGQLGCVFAGYLKVITPLLFFTPGILCKILHPDLDDPNKAYMTMVTTYLPTGMVGLIVAVLIAALVSTVDSGLNSLSTVFTLDIYQKLFKSDAGPKHLKQVGRIVTVVGAVFAMGFALSMELVKDMGLFALIQSIIGFLAPPMAAIFIIGVIWRRATSTAAFCTLIIGTIICMGTGATYLSKVWPWLSDIHFLLLSFYLFAVLCSLMVILSLVTRPDNKAPLPRIREAYQSLGYRSAKAIWLWWAGLAVIMVGIYLFFGIGR